MAFHRCTILEDDTVVCTNVDVSLEEVKDQEPARWYGTISVTYQAGLTAGKRYCLTLDDGRTGEFMVQRNTFAGGEDRAVAFRGTGPLE
jgi:hypothetical protein